MKKIYQRSKALLIQPQSKWMEISSEKQLRKEVVFEFLLPVSLIIGLCSLLGSLFSEGIEDSFSITYLLISGAISFLIIFLEVYLSGWLITEIALSFDPDTDSHAIFNLVTYSHTPFLITLALTRLVPQLFFVNILGAWSFFLYWTGIEYFTNLTDDRKPVLMILSSLVMILMYLLLTVIFNSIYDVVLNHFTTFTR